MNNINAEKSALEATITTLHSDLSHCREGLSGAIANSSQLEHDKVVLEEEKVKILLQVILYVVYIWFYVYKRLYSVRAVYVI